MLPSIRLKQRKGIRKKKQKRNKKKKRDERNYSSIIESILLKFNCFLRQVMKGKRKR